MSWYTAVVLTIILFFSLHYVNARDIPKITNPKNILSNSKTQYPCKSDTKNQFPKDFLFGSSSSAYQIEGGWDRDGKGPSIWDDYTQNHPEFIKDGSNGNVAANSYAYYEKDVKALKNIGVNFYRFSISWPRVLPDGDISSKNELGLQYYDKLINKLLENDIEPMVTMYHWDLPSSLQELGGWTNPIIVEYFVQYAKVLLDRYGDRVKNWNTLNEPNVFCVEGYGLNEKAPGLNDHGIGEYLCGHHVLLANARVYEMYRRDYFIFGSSMSIVINSDFDYPENPDKIADRLAAERSMQFWAGWFAHPIYSKSGDYPSIMRTIIDQNSKDENLQWSRLPSFTKEEIELIRGSSDIFSLNTYTGRYARDGIPIDSPLPSFAGDRFTIRSQNDSWPSSGAHWLRYVPGAMRNMLNWIKNEYNNPDLIITENGWPENTGELNDTERIAYMNNNLQDILDAIWKDGCRIFGYTYWSIIDNFEWLDGYSSRFGLYRINYDDEQKERIAKSSVSTLRNIIKTRQLEKKYGN